jgi:hypothetical protein
VKHIVKNKKTETNYTTENKIQPEANLLPSDE